MNRLHLFNTWIAIFFIILTTIFIGASCFYIIQLFILNHKNKISKRQNNGLEESVERCKYSKKVSENIQLASKLNQPVNKDKLKKRKEPKNGPKKSIFKFLFKKPNKQTIPYHFAPRDSQFFELNAGRYNLDDIDGLDVFKTQSYESFETMTTDSECYRDWRHSIDFSNNILNMNYNPTKQNEVLQKAFDDYYSQIDKQQQPLSELFTNNLTTNSNKTNSLTKSNSYTQPSENSNKKSDFIMNDLYPLSVVPLDFEPQPIHLYNVQAQIHQDKIVNNKVNKSSVNESINRLENKKDDKNINKNNETKSNNVDKNMNLVSQNHF